MTSVDRFDESTDEILIDYLNDEMYRKLLEAQKENHQLSEQVKFLARALQRNDAIIHEFESALMHGGAKAETIIALRQHAAKKAGM